MKRELSEQELNELFVHKKQFDKALPDQAFTVKIEGTHDDETDIWNIRVNIQRKDNDQEAFNKLAQIFLDSLPDGTQKIDDHTYMYELKLPKDKNNG